MTLSYTKGHFGYVKDFWIERLVKWYVFAEGEHVLLVVAKFLV